MATKAEQKIEIENRTESIWDFGLVVDGRPVRWGRTKDRNVPADKRDERFRPNPIRVISVEQFEALEGRKTLQALIDKGDFQVRAV